MRAGEDACSQRCAADTGPAFAASTNERATEVIAAIGAEKGFVVIQRCFGCGGIGGFRHGSGGSLDLSHPERSEGSRRGDAEILRCAQNDDGCKGALKGRGRLRSLKRALREPCTSTTRKLSG